MKMRIQEFARLTGVSVRTLHYYDEIELLVPACVDKDTGYRYYDQASLLRMQEILFYRELDFSLKSIGQILSSPNYDAKQSLSEQRNLLILKKERLERLISAIDHAMKGENVMSAFDNSKFDAYKAEARQRWGEHGRLPGARGKNEKLLQNQVERAGRGNERNIRGVCPVYEKRRNT